MSCMARSAALVLLPTVCCAQSTPTPPPLPPKPLLKDSDNSEPTCWNDAITGETLGCKKQFDDEYCSASFNAQGVMDFNLADRAEVEGIDTCALWLWGNTGKAFGVWWDGVYRGKVDADACVQLYVPPGYTMDTSNITLTCIPPGGCSVEYALNPPGTTCSANGNITLTTAATAGIIASCLCCAAVCAALCWCAFCRLVTSPSRREYTAVAVPVQQGIPIAQGERAPIYVGVPIQQTGHVQTGPTQVCSAAPAPPPPPVAL